MDTLAGPLDRADGPLYRQAAGRLRGAITSGQLGVGAALPAEAALAAQFGVSLITIRQALRALADEGLIRKRPAKTAIVAAARRPAPQVRQLNSLEDIVANTRDARLEIDHWRKRRSAAAARAFGLDPATQCHCLHGRLTVASLPVAEISTFFPPAIGRRLTRADFDDVVVFRSVERRLGIRLAHAHITMRAELADAGLARALDCAPGAPILVNEMLYHDVAGTPVELTIARHPGERYSLSYDVRGSG